MVSTITVADRVRKRCCYLKGFYSLFEEGLLAREYEFSHEATLTLPLQAAVRDELKRSVSSMNSLPTPSTSMSHPASPTATRNPFAASMGTPSSARPSRTASASTVTATTQSNRSKPVMTLVLVHQTSDPPAYLGQLLGEATVVGVWRVCMGCLWQCALGSCTYGIVYVMVRGTASACVSMFDHVTVCLFGNVMACFSCLLPRWCSQLQAGLEEANDREISVARQRLMEMSRVARYVTIVAACSRWSAFRLCCPLTSFSPCRGVLFVLLYLLTFVPQRPAAPSGLLPQHASELAPARVAGRARREGHPGLRVHR